MGFITPNALADILQVPVERIVEFAKSENCYTSNQDMTEAELRDPKNEGNETVETDLFFRAMFRTPGHADSVLRDRSMVRNTFILTREQILNASKVSDRINSDGYYDVLRSLAGEDGSPVFASPDSLQVDVATAIVALAQKVSQLRAERLNYGFAVQTPGGEIFIGAKDEDILREGAKYLTIGNGATAAGVDVQPPKPAEICIYGPDGTSLTFTGDAETSKWIAMAHFGMPHGIMPSWEQPK